MAMTSALDSYTIYSHLRQAGVPLRASVSFGDGVAAALWARDETVDTRYVAPNHHTLSLYVAGGSGITRRQAGGVLRNEGPGSLCIMPAGVSTDWDVSGPVEMFHLYIHRPVFDRAVVETLDADPAGVSLRDDTYVRDQTIEAVIRAAMLPLDWNEPAERVTTSHAGQMLIAYLAARFTDRAPQALVARGGLAPAALRRVVDFIEAHLASPLAIQDLADAVGLSPYHFARAFKRATGEPPHRFVLRRRIARARDLIAAGTLPLAEVALAAGFSSQSHLTQRFRELTGLTPGQFAASLGRRD